MNNRKLLFVSIAFPPKNDPECVQAGRFAHYLWKNHHWDITVVTSKIPTLFMPYDKSLERLTEGLKLIEVPIYESKLTNKLVSILHKDLLNRPDSKFTFYQQWKRFTHHIEKPDIIYSRSFPLSSTIMALRLKSHFNVPWIMHLSDPWVESPLHQMNTKFHQKYEKRAFDLADFISFTTEEALSLYQKKYPHLDQKFFLNTNTFEKANIEATKKTIEKKEITIVYTGGLANTRDAKLFLTAFSQARKLSDNSLSNINVVFAGDMDAQNRAMFTAYQKISNIKHMGLQTQEKSHELQSAADILLVIDSKINDTSRNVFLPSKLIDYATWRKVLVAITDKSSPTEKFIQKYGGYSFSFDEVEKLTEFILELSEGKIDMMQKSQIPQEYSIAHQVGILNQKLKSQVQ